MRLLPHLVSYMAETVVAALAREKLVSSDDESRLAGLVENVIIADLEAEERLDEEARELLSRHYEQVRDSGAHYRKLFNKIKAKLAKERGIIL